VVFTIIVIVVLLTLSATHFYWSFGGKWGFDQALPKSANGHRLFTPSKAHSAAVGTGMLILVVYLLIRTELISVSLPNFILDYGIWFFALIFVLRAVGDFKYVGFFKRVRNTNFGKLDSKYYSPLCLLLGILMILIETSI